MKLFLIQGFCIKYPINLLTMVGFSCAHTSTTNLSLNVAEGTAPSLDSFMSDLQVVLEKLQWVEQGPA